MPSDDVMAMLGLCAGYVDLGVVSDSDVRFDDLKIVRSLGSGTKSAVLGEAVDVSGSITQFRDILILSGVLFSPRIVRTSARHDVSFR